MRKLHNLMIAGLLIAFVAAGFFREFVFLNWNEQIRVTYYHASDSHVHSTFQWLSGISYTGLYWLKWPLTLAFSVLFTALAVMIVNLLFRNRSYNLLTIYAYTTVFFASFLFFGFGWLFGELEVSYTVARFLAGIIETPAMLIILTASFLVHRKL